MSNEAAPRKKRGCLFYGCLSLIIAGFLAVILLVGGFFVVRRVMVNTFTETTSQTIETVSYEPEERDALQRRVAAFSQALTAGKGGEELILSAHDLNILIAENADLKGKLFVIIDDDKLQGRVSVPLADYGIVDLSGRYLNGLATFKVALKGGVLDLRVEDVQVKSKPLPSAILTQIKQKNLAADFQRNPQQQDQLRKFESIRIEQGKVFLRTRETPPDAENKPPAR